MKSGYPSRCYRAFTLVELLVVIGIIAVLVAILMPALNKAREAGKAVQCMSNLRQIGVGFFNYGANGGTYYPPAMYGINDAWYSGNQSWHGPTYAQTVYWYNIVLPETRQLRGTKVLFCPNSARAFRDPVASTKSANVSYGYNWLSVAGTPTSFWSWHSTGAYDYLQKPARIGKVKRAAETMLVAEAAINNNKDDWMSFNRQHGDVTNGVLRVRHGKTCNVLWADGHVSYIESKNGTDAGLIQVNAAGVFPYSWSPGRSKVYPDFWVRPR